MHHCGYHFSFKFLLKSKVKFKNLMYLLVKDETWLLMSSILASCIFKRPRSIFFFFSSLFESLITYPWYFQTYCLIHWFTILFCSLFKTFAAEISSLCISKWKRSLYERSKIPEAFDIKNWVEQIKIMPECF